jgi:hypothetical protein
MISFAIDFLISLVAAIAVYSYANTNIIKAINNQTITSFAAKTGAFCFLIILGNRIFGGSINVPFLFTLLLYIPLGAMDSNHKDFNEDEKFEIQACAKKIRLGTILAGVIGLLAYSPRFNWLQIDFSGFQGFENDSTLNIVLFVIGQGLLFGGYSDLIRHGRYLPQTLFNTLIELIGGILLIVTFIWSFFVFDWWVPVILCTIFGGLVSAVVKFKLINFPQLHIILGIPLSIFALL